MMKWISVKTKKPKMGQKVLVYRQGYHSSQSVHNKNKYYSETDVAWWRHLQDNRRRHFASRDHYEAYGYEDVTHWMGLPPDPVFKLKSPEGKNGHILKS